jgi:hypothetical protein
MEIVFWLMVGWLVGWAFIWVIKQQFGHKCPSCRGTVPGDATKCGHCGTEFGTQARTVTAEQERIARDKAREIFLRKKQAHPWLYWEFSGWKLAAAIVVAYLGLLLLTSILEWLGK